jgi:hypothetical protein
VRRTNGAPGIDKTALADVKENGVTRLLGERAAELRAGTWRPLPARQVLIPSRAEPSGCPAHRWVHRLIWFPGNLFNQLFERSNTS